MWRHTDYYEQQQGWIVIYHVVQEFFLLYFFGLAAIEARCMVFDLAESWGALRGACAWVGGPSRYSRCCCCCAGFVHGMEGSGVRAGRLISMCNCYLLS